MSVHITPALLLQAVRKRKQGADIKLVVAGCVAQQEGATLLRRVPELDLVMGPQHANQCVCRHALDCPAFWKILLF